MMSNKNAAIIGLLINVLSIILLVLNVICFINMKNGNDSLLLLCTIFNIIDLFLTGGKGFIILVPFIIFNFIYHKNLWFSIQLSLLYENILCCIFILITAILGLIEMKRNK